MRFSAPIIVLAILVVACGPKPDVKVITDGSPAAVWESFLSRIPDIDSIAIKGKIKLRSTKTYEFGFEAYYIDRDTLNFTARGPLGTGWIRVILLGDSVYVTNSKDNIPILYDKAERIYFGDMDNHINISTILKALYLTIPGPGAAFAGAENGQLRYQYDSGSEETQLYVDPDNCLPSSQLTRTNSDVYRSTYSEWKMVNKNQFYPKIIIMESSSSRGSLQLKINSIKINAKIPRTLFRY